MNAARRARLAQRVEALRDQGLERGLRPLAPTGPCTALLDGEPVDVFSSNDSLGLAWALREAWRGGGSGSSRLISGDRPAHHALEAALEARWGRPALVFSSGYHANLAVLTTLFERGQVVASDALNHASLIDGLRLSRCERVLLPHGEPPSPQGLDGAVVEGLYSMDGDRLRLADYAGGHWLVVDEAHAVGCVGPEGRGVAAAQGLEPDVLIGTFGKAFGAAGAFVVGPPELKALLISRGRSFVYTTGLAEPAAAAALAGLEAATEERRERLRARIRSFRAGLAQLGLTTRGEDHIVPVVLGERTMPAAAALLGRGIYVPGIRWPTVPRGQERLRFSLSAAHTEEQIDRALEALRALAV